MNDKISELNEEYRIIATTGIADPNLGVPYISLEELFQGDRGKRQLIEHLENSQTWYVESKTPAPKVDQTAAANYLEQYYTFINPKKVIGVLWQYCDLLAKERQLKLTDARRLALIMHLGGAIERVLLSAPVTLTEEQAVEFEQSDWPQALKLADEYLEAKLNLKFPSAEAYYIAKLVDTEMVES